MKNHHRKLSVCLVVTALIAGCAKSEFTSTIEDVNDGVLKKADRPYCEMDPTDYVVASKVHGYEITSKNKGKFGFNFITKFFKSLGLSFKIEKGEIWVTTGAYSPTSYDFKKLPEQNSEIKMGSKVTTDTSKEIQVDIDFGVADFGWDQYSKSPFFKISQKGLEGSVSDLLEKLKSVETPWSTKVVDVVNGMVVIPTGMVAGLQEQDEFEIYNVNYSWKGSPCGEYVIPVPTTETPVATGKVIHLDTYGAALKITHLIKEEKIDIGAIVKVKDLANNEKKQRKLLRSVKVVDMASNPIDVESNQQLKIDFGKFANTQFRIMLSSYGFYMRPN